MSNTIPFPPKNDDSKDQSKPSEHDSPLEDRNYSSDEVSEIIRISLQQENRASSNAVDYEELLSIGKDMGVTEDQIEKSIKLLAEEQRTKSKEDELWLKFKAHCFISVSVILLCLGLNIFTGLDSFWSGYPLFALGFFLLGHYVGIRYVPEFVAMATERTLHYANDKWDEYAESDSNVTFSVSDDLGLSECSGMLFLEDEQLVVEYQNSDSILGLLSSKVKEIEIPISDLRRARLQQKFWNSEISIQGKSMKTFRKLPCEVSGTFSFTVEKKSQKAAESLVKNLNALIK